MIRMFWWIVYLLFVIDFFGRVEIFVGILIINGKIVLVLNLKKKKIFKMDLLFVDVDKKNWGMYKILNDFCDDIVKG